MWRQKTVSFLRFEWKNPRVWLLVWAQWWSKDTNYNYNLSTLSSPINSVFERKFWVRVLVMKATRPTAESAAGIHRLDIANRLHLCISLLAKAVDTDNRCHLFVKAPLYKHCLFVRSSIHSFALHRITGVRIGTEVWTTLVVNNVIKPMRRTTTL